MLINVKYDQNHKIFALASKIVSDWDSIIQKENGFHQQVKDKKFQTYHVHLLGEDQQQRVNKNANLVIVMKKSKMSSANMLALSQQLSTFGQKQDNFIPLFVAEVAIANCIAILILQCYYSELSKQSPAQDTKILLIDPVDCLKYLGAFNISSKSNKMMLNTRGNNILDGGAPFYAIYQTKKGLLAVGNLQPKFYQQMVQQMQLSEQQKQFCKDNQLNFEAWPKIRQIFKNKFKQKTAQEWQKIMMGRDTCITEVRQDHNQSKNFVHPSLIKPKL